MSLKIKWALAAGLLMAVSLHADDFQTWTDATGKYKIEAKFIKLENDVVLLEEKDKSQSRIPLNKLSQEDQEKALNLARAKAESPPKKETEKDPGSDKPNPPKVAEFRKWKLMNGKTIEGSFLRSQGDNIILLTRDGKEVAVDRYKLHFDEVGLLTNLLLEEISRRNEERRESDASATRNKLKETDKGLSGPAQLTNLDCSHARHIVLTDKPWTAPDITPFAVDWQPRPTVFPRPVNHREHIDQLLISIASRLVLAVSHVNGNTNNDRVTRFIVANASSGKYQRDYLVRGDYRVLAFAPDGKSLLVHEHLIGKPSSEVELWQLTGKGIERTHRWSFTVKEAEFHSEGSVETAHFLANGTRALIMTNYYYFVVDIEADKPICYGKLDSKITPTVSPDERFLFAVYNKQLFAVNLESGMLMGSAPLEKKSLYMGGPLAVSPDGRKIAHKAIGVIIVYDLQTGQELFQLPSSPLGEVICWTGTESLMAGGDMKGLVYFDTVLNYPIWEVHEVKNVAFVGKYGMFYVDDSDDRRGLVVSPLPHASAQRVVNQAKNDPNFFIVKPGARFRVDASLIKDPALQQQFKAAIEKRITECGHIVDPGARLTIQIDMTREQDYDMTYRNNFPRNNNKIEEYKVKIPRWIYHVTILSGNDPLWAKYDYDLPPLGILVTKEQPLEQHISKFSAPNADCFKKFVIPQYVPREARATGFSVQPLHKSDVTINGIR